MPWEPSGRFRKGRSSSPPGFGRNSVSSRGPKCRSWSTAASSISSPRWMIRCTRPAALFPLNPPLGIGFSWIGRRIPVEGEGSSSFRQPRSPEVVPEGGGTQEGRSHACTSDAIGYADVHERDPPGRDRLLYEARFRGPEEDRGPRARGTPWVPHPPGTERPGLSCGRVQGVIQHVVRGLFRPGIYRGIRGGPGYRRSRVPGGRAPRHDRMGVGSYTKVDTVAREGYIN